MNSVELYKEIRRLQEIRIRNKESIPAEELSGKYKKSYDKLLGEIKEMQIQYRTDCARNIRIVHDWLSKIIYIDPTENGYEEVAKLSRNSVEESGNDPMVSAILINMTVLLGQVGGVNDRKDNLQG